MWVKTSSLLFVLMMTVFFLTIQQYPKPICEREINLIENEFNCTHFQISDTELMDYRSDPVENFLIMQRQKIVESMLYKSIDESYKFEELVPEKGRKAFKNIIITPWKSNRTILADLLDAMPGSFNHFHNLNLLTNLYDSENMAKIISNLFNCYFEDVNLMNYVKMDKNHEPFCSLYNESCVQDKFLERFCKLFPIQTMKIDELDLKIIFYVLHNKLLKAKVIYIIGDPRGDFGFKDQQTGCSNEAFCSNITVFCNSLNEDAEKVKNLSKLFPENFKVIRYEDFLSDPYNTVKKVLKFYGLVFNNRIIEYLDSHTNNEISEGYQILNSTFLWTKNVSFPEIYKIQEECKQMMETFGYTFLSEADFITKINLN